MLDEPIRPEPVGAGPPLRSALAAGERQPDGQDDDELGLFEPDSEEEIEGEATEAMPSPALGADSNPPEGREPNILRGPVRPSAEAVDRHNATHMPYRSWCEVCVKARGKEDPHRRKRAKKVEELGEELRRASLDYQELKSKAKRQASEEDHSKLS